MIPLHDDNPSSSKPLVTLLLLAACVLVFLWQLSLGAAGRRAVLALGLIPAVLLGRVELPAELSVVAPPLTMLTSMFMHGGWLHLIGNMLFLWVFADNVEDSMGHGRFVLFYVVWWQPSPKHFRTPHRRFQWSVPAVQSPACSARTCCCIHMPGC
jgi:membrane associated rhomboid family serine protease